MQENQTSNPIIQSVSDSVPTVTTVPANDQQPKTNSFLVILLSILLIISVAIAGLFAYQTQKLGERSKIANDASKQTETSTTLPTMKPKGTYDNVDSWTLVKYKDSFSFRYPPIELSSSIDYQFTDDDMLSECYSKTKSENRYINGKKLTLDYYIYLTKGICSSDDLNRLVLQVPGYPLFMTLYRDSEKDLAISFLDTIVSTFKFGDK